MKPGKPPLTKLKFIEPMYALSVQKLPEGKDWLYEVKFDGYRCLAGRDSTGVNALVQAKKPLHKAIPADRPSL
jgi:bifunctional non-homologous end joining protein LigD